MKPDDAKRLADPSSPDANAGLVADRRRQAPPQRADARAAGRQPARARRRCSASPAWSLLAGIAYGAYWALVLQPLRVDRQRLRAGQRRAAHAAGRRHRRRHRRRRHRLRQGRPAAGAGSTRPTRGSRSSRPRRSSRRRCAKCAPCSPTTAPCRRRSRCARPTWRARRPTWRAPQDDVARRAPLVATGAVGKEEFNHVDRRSSRPRKSALAGRRSRRVAAAREQLASNQSLTDGITVEQHPNVLRAAARGARGVPRAARAPSCSRRSTATSRKRSVQLGQRVAGRRAADVGDRARARCGSTPTSRKASCATCASASRSSSTPTSTARRSSTTARSKAWAPAPARRSRCCRRRTRPATGSRSCSACRCAIALDPKEAGRASAARRPVDGRQGRRQQHRRPHARRRARARRLAAQTSGLRRGQRRRPTPTCARSSPPTSAGRSPPSPSAAPAAAARRRRPSAGAGSRSVLGRTH